MNASWPSSGAVKSRSVCRHRSVASTRLPGTVDQATGDNRQPVEVEAGHKSRRQRRAQLRRRVRRHTEDPAEHRVMRRRRTRHGGTVPANTDIPDGAAQLAPDPHGQRGRRSAVCQTGGNDSAEFPARLAYRGVHFADDRQRLTPALPLQPRGDTTAADRAGGVAVAARTAGLRLPQARDSRSARRTYGKSRASGGYATCRRTGPPLAHPRHDLRHPPPPQRARTERSAEAKGPPRRPEF